MARIIYLDHAATTPVDERVLAAMQPYFTEAFGNPSSVHRYGQQAERAVDSARETVAGILNCMPQEIIFTSCGTESDNLAIRGAAFSARERSGADRILTSRVEHHAVSRTAEQLAQHHGFSLDWLEIDEHGSTHPGAVRRELGPHSAVVSVMYANNEIGTINPIGEIAAACRERGTLMHADAVQAAAYLPLDVKALGTDLLSLGGHKFHGPKGVGALYVRSGTRLLSSQTGGSQEFGLRAGTQNVPLIVGFAKALELAQQERGQRTEHATLLRDHIIGTVLELIPDSRLTGSPGARLPNHASFAFKDVDGNLLLILLDTAGFACSSGSACKTGDPEPSEVLTAIGLPREWGLGSLRVTVGKDSTAAEVEAFLKALPRLVEKARALKQAPM
ncbi:MAG: cysteine desulfurase family protein [Chloroflexota bacterium]